MLIRAFEAETGSELVHTLLTAISRPFALMILHDNISWMWVSLVLPVPAPGFITLTVEMTASTVQPSATRTSWFYYAYSKKGLRQQVSLMLSVIPGFITHTLKGTASMGQPSTVSTSGFYNAYSQRDCVNGSA